jgi:hypothetical protein
MEAFLERVWLELLAIAVQVAIVRFVQWLRSRSPAGSGGLEAAWP